MRRLGFVLLILLLIFTGDSRFSGNSAGDSLAAETVDNQHNEDSSS